LTHDPVSLPGAASGVLARLRFAAKDNFEIEGRRSCGGNPDWARSTVELRSYQTRED